MTDAPSAHSNRAKAIVDQCYEKADNTGRLGLALDLLGHETSGAVFWTVLCELWCLSDNTWNHQPQLCFSMAFFARTRRRYIPVEKQPPDYLPKIVTVWRGCSMERVQGVSWTLDRTVAEKFARGHRGIEVPNPVLASAEIHKTAIYFVENEREEQEVVLDPSKLRAIVIDNV